MDKLSNRIYLLIGSLCWMFALSGCSEYESAGPKSNIVFEKFSMPERAMVITDQCHYHQRSGYWSDRLELGSVIGQHACFVSVVVCESKRMQAGYGQPLCPDDRQWRSRGLDPDSRP